MPTNPPGANLPNPPTIAGPGFPAAGEPTSEQRAAIEAAWRNAAPALADLILLVNAHPELLEWARASKAGTVRLANG